MIAAAGAAIYLLKRTPPPEAQEFAYILPDSVALHDSPAEVRLNLATLRHGERIEVLARTARWARVRIADGKIGWIAHTHLIDGPSYEKGLQLLEGMKRDAAQAAGRTTALANLRAEPARDAPQISQLASGERVEIFDRRMVDRSAQPAAAGGGDVAREAWYLVRAGERGGWALGRLISLDIPEAISHYAQGFNLVAWLVISSVDDSGRSVPQYVAADRVEAPEFDFTRIRVFTWSVQRQQYATAYVESNLKGYFPIRVEQAGGAPQFRLRLEDRKGKQIQKIYRMQDTIVRLLGTVDGWESNALPEQRPAARARGR